jgi:phage virion morphogenesis protein
LLKGDYKKITGNRMAINDLNTSINALFSRLKERFTPDKNLMDAVADHLHQSVMENFVNQGTNITGGWKPLKTSTLKMKRRKGLSERILEATGNLKRSIKTGSTESDAWIFSDAPYGAIHNFGGTINLQGRTVLFHRKGRRKETGFKEKIIKIPARPFLVLTEGFKEKIVEEIRKQVGSPQ